MVAVKALERPNPEKLTGVTEAEQRDGGIEEAVDLKAMYVFGRAVGVDEGKVAFQQLSDVGGSRVVDGDLALFMTRSCTIQAELRGPGALRLPTCRELQQRPGCRG